MSEQVPDSAPASDANIASHLRHMAATQAQRLAIACPRAGLSSLLPWPSGFTELSFKQLDDWSENIARGLVLAGIGPGTRVALLVPPGPEFFAAVFALMKCGAIMICIDPGIGVRALGRCINHSRPRAIIGSSKAHLARRMLAWGRDTNRLNIIATDNAVVLSGDPQPTRTLRSLSEAGEACTNRDLSALPMVDAHDTAAILFTSGSTGPPKGVVYSHATFQAQIQLLRASYGIQPGEVDLSTFPLFALFAPALGMSAVIPKMDFTRPARVRPENIIDAVQRYDVTSLFGSPALLRRLGHWNRRHPHTLPSLRRVICAGAPVAASVIADLLPMLNHSTHLHTPYGATEILPVSTIDSHEILTQTALQTALGKGVCVGQPVSGVNAQIIEISDAAHAEADPISLEVGVIGEIIVSGANLSMGYDHLDDAQRKARFCDARGRRWHRMGDSGYIDEQGRLWFCGRVAHRVVTRERIYYPICCEGIFNTHPKVYRSALIRLDSGRDTRPALCVELEAGTAKSTCAKILTELLEIGARFEHTQPIHKLFFHPAFPVDIRHNAKIDREQLGHWASARDR